MANADDFIAWATNPKLNIEEAFCAEVIVEKATELWRMQNRMADPEGLDLKRERHKKRCLNPAHRIQLNTKDVERAASALDNIQHFSFYASKYSHDDRPLRDITGLRFLRSLKDLSLHGVETSDVSVLAGLPQLKKLLLWDEELEDMRPFERCVALESLSLHISQPWPQTTSLERLPELKSFEWRGNVFALEGIGPLPHVTRAKFEGGFQWKLPLRNLLPLPVMPKLRVFELDPVWSIEGIDRWPGITNLTLNGIVRDLRPLHSLTQLTHLTLKTERLRNVQQLVGVPRLKYLLVDSEHPVDFSALTDAPHLHEIEVKRCEINRMEVATLNSVLTPWDDEFAAPEPRTLPPLRFRLVPDREAFKGSSAEAASADEIEADPGLLASEARWVKRKIASRLNQLLGGKKWGGVDATDSGLRAASITINSLEAAERLPKIIESVRQVLAQSKHRWEVHLHISLESEWSQQYPELEKELQKQRLIDEHLQFEKRQQERKEFLERKHRAELLQQEGMKVKPEDFAAPEQSSETEAADSFDNTLQMPDEPEPHPTAEQLNCMARFNEKELVAGQSYGAAIQQLMGRKAE